MMKRAHADSASLMDNELAAWDASSAVPQGAMNHKASGLMPADALWVMGEGLQRNDKVSRLEGQEKGI